MNQEQHMFTPDHESEGHEPQGQDSQVYETSPNHKPEFKGHKYASQELASLFSHGMLPMTPLNYVIHFTSRVRCYIRDKGQMLTIPQVIGTLKEMGFAPSIESIELLSSLVAILENEMDATTQTVCCVILHLSSTGKQDERRRSVSNYLWNFVSTNRRQELVELISRTGRCPFFSGGALPTPDLLIWDEDEWPLFFRGLMGVLFKENSPFAAYDATKTEWSKLSQTSSISEYVFQEVNLWSTMSSQCLLLGIEPPTHSQRVNRMLCNLASSTKGVVADELRSKGKRCEYLTYPELVSMLNEAQVRADISFPWECQRKEVEPRSDKSTPSRHADARRQDDLHNCHFCLRKNVRHKPEECYGNPKNITQRPKFMRSDYRIHGDRPKDSRVANSQNMNRQSYHIQSDQSPEAPPSPGDLYELPPLIQAREQVGPKAGGSDGGDIFSFTVKAECAKLFGFRANVPGVGPITVGFDSLSSVSLIRQGLGSIVSDKPPDPITLHGIGGHSQISGQRNAVLLEVEGARFRITGYTCKTPISVDVLIGIPQIQKMNLTLTYTDQGAMATVGSLGNLSIPLIPLTSRAHNPSLTITEQDLPHMEVAVKPGVSKIPFQCKRGYSIPIHLQEATRSEILSEIELGHLKEVQYDSNMWISPLFVKAKEKLDPETGLPRVRLLADLKLLNPNLVHPEYWAHMGPNRSTFAGFIRPSSNLHFAKIDISNAFHTCPVAENSRHLLVVRYEDKLLQYLTAPQGLATSALFWPLHLSAGLNALLGEEWQGWCGIYVDDILIVGRGYDECELRTQTILTALRNMGKKISDKSVTEPATEMDCIGLKFTQTGICFTDEAIQKLKTALTMRPKSSKDMRRIIGSVTYASSAITLFPISKLGDTMKPLHQSISGKQFRFSDEITRSLDLIAASITNAPVPYTELEHLVDEHHILVINTDASDAGTGAALYRCRNSASEILDDAKQHLQNSTLLSLDCHSLSEGESRWHTFETEALAIYRAIRKWKSILIGAIKDPWEHPKIVILSDSRTTLARWSRPEKISSGSAKAKRFEGWALEMSFLRFLPVTYGFIDGENNSLADLFSRIAHDLNAEDSGATEDDSVAQVWMSDGTTQPSNFRNPPLTPDIVSKISEGYSKDEESTYFGHSIKAIFEAASGGGHQPIRKLIEGKFAIGFHPAALHTETPLLYVRASHQIVDDSDQSIQNFVLVIPQTSPGEPMIAEVMPLYTHGISLRRELLMLSHDLQGHSGESKTAGFLLEFCWWPKILEDIKGHINNCVQCAASHKFRKPSGFQVIGSDRFTRIQMDHKLLPKAIHERTGQVAILTVVDTVTGVVSISPVQNLSAAETAYSLVTNWIRFYGIPRVIQTDNSTSFTNTHGDPNEVIREVCRILGTKLKPITPYNPTANGKVERKHLDLGKWISGFEGYITDERTLRLILAIAEASLNQNSRAYLLTFGKEPRTLQAALAGPALQSSGEQRDLLNHPNYRDEFERLLKCVTLENTKWHNHLSDETARRNAANVDANRISERSTMQNIRLGDEVTYDNRNWKITDLKYGPSAVIPTSAKLREVGGNDANETWARCDAVRPIPRPEAVNSLAPSWAEVEEGSFVFFSPDGHKDGTYAGRVMRTWAETVLVHMYSPTRRRLGYEANWWKRKPDGEWEVVPLNPKAASLLKPLTQLVDCREIFAKGKISDKGIISEDLKTQLHSRGVFEPSSSASPPAQGAMQ